MDRPADPGVSPRVPSGHVLSETAGAERGLRLLIGSIGWKAHRVICRPKAACTDGETGIFGRWRGTPTSFEFGSRPFNQGFRHAARRSGDRIYGAAGFVRAANATGGVAPASYEESNRG